MRKKLAAIPAVAVLALGGAAVANTGASATEGGAATHPTVAVHKAHLEQLNNSGVKGRAKVLVQGKHLTVKFKAKGLLRNMPHAAHIHQGEQATHECPTVRLDKNRDHRLNTAEGLPAYGPIRRSLTTRGDTSPASALAVDRFSSAPNGRISYDRHMYIGRDFRRDLRNNEGVLVIHGLDYNQNGKYDFNGAGKSELDPSLPAEATDPAACGVIKFRYTQ